MTSRVSDHVITFHHYYYTNIHGRYVMDDGWNIQFDVCLSNDQCYAWIYIYIRKLIYPAKYTTTVYINVYIYTCIYIFHALCNCNFL